MKTFFRKWIFRGLVPLFLVALPGSLHASVSIEVAIGRLLDIGVGDVGLLVVDVDGNGFQTPQEGIQLDPGNTIGLSDDVILAVFAAEDGEHWDAGSGGVGFSGMVSIDLDALGVAPGDALKFYWLPGKQEGDVTSQGETWYSFRSDSVGGSGGTSEFLTPDEFGVYRLSYLAADLGGNFDSANPGNSGDYTTGLHLTLVGNLASEAVSADTVQLSWDVSDGAQMYRVHRSSTADFADSEMVGTTTDPDFTDSDLPVGEFYYWVESVFSNGSSYAALDTAGSTVIAIPRLAVKSGTVKPKGTKPGKGFSYLRNAGPGDGTFKLSGSPGNKYNKLKYFRTSSGRANVTATVRAGIHQTQVLANNGIESFEVQVKPSGAYKKLARGGRRAPGKARKYNVDLRASPVLNAVGSSVTRIKFVRK